MRSRNQTKVDFNTFSGRFTFVVDKINQILSKRNSIILHKNFINNIINGMENYAKDVVPNLELSKRIYNETICNKFNEFDVQLNTFNTFLQQVSKKDQIETILTSSYKQNIIFIDEYRKQFNYYIIELKLFIDYVRPLRKIAEDDIVHQILDIKIYREIINNALQRQNSKYTENNIITLKNRLDEVNACNDQLNVKMQILQKKFEKSNIEIDQETFKSKIKKVTNSIIDYNDIEIQYKIGHGSEGIVNLGYQKSTQRVIAVKQILYNRLDYYIVSLIKRQVKIMTDLKNFAILQFIGVCLDPVCLINEYMSNGSLYDRLHDTNPETQLTPTKRTIIALGLAYALNYMHKKSPPLLHRDVKSLNVLLDSEDFPKLCDFGASRYKDEENDLKPRGVGTTNWMAPEVIKGYEYTEKSDVYSYGVVLWELLTGLAPFVELNERRIKDEVAYNNKRLEIQRHDCPQEFRSLLARCWATDATKRPSFDQIIELFESGTVKFIGTETDQVKAYISLFQSSSPENDQCFDFPVVTDSIVNNICNELDANKEEGILKANSVLSKEENHQFVLQFKLISSIAKAIDKCNSSRSANLLTKTVDIIVNHKLLTDEFEKEEGSSKFIKLFVKFGATAKKNIIQTLLCLISNVSNVVVNYNAISKISPFLLFNNLSCRLNSLKLLNTICDMKYYDSENSFNIIIRNVLANIFPKAKIEVIIESLDLLLKLVKFSDLNLSLLSTEGVIKLTSMINHSNLDVSMKSLKIIEELLKLTVPQKNVVKSVLACISDVAKNQNNDQIKEILIIMAYLLKSKVTFVKIQSKDNIGIIDCFKQFLSSSDNEIVVNSLKLCFSFIFNSVPQFIDLHDNYYDLLAKDDRTISTLAASCLTLVYQKRPFKLTDTKKNNLIENFLKRELSSDLSSINSQILNLCGVISTSLDGAIFFDDIELISLLLNLIKKDNNNTSQISRISTMILASLSALNPLCKHLTEAFPLILNMMKINLNSPYPIVFITNMASTSEGAFECAKNISHIIKNAEVDFPRTIVAIQRTITDSKAKEEIFTNEKENVNSLISLLMKKWNPDNVFLSIVNEMAALESGRKAIVDSGLLNVLKKQFAEIDLANESRPLLLRILSKVKS